MAFGDNWSLDDFHQELVMLMNAGNFSDLEEVLRIESDILNGKISDEDKNKIIHQTI